MATKRYISTSFWDDEWVHNLDPSEKLMYLYFMTNTLTNIAGVYKISTDRISYDTGFNKKTIENIMKKFYESKKLVYVHGYVIIPTWPRHQSWQTKDKIKSGIDAVLNSLPDNILEEMARAQYDYIHDRLSIDYHSNRDEPNYSNSNSNSDTDYIMGDSDKPNQQKRKKFIPPTLDEVRAYFAEKGTRIDPIEFFNYYSGSDWKKSNGGRVTDWKKCLTTWEKNANNGYGRKNEMRIQNQSSFLDMEEA